MNYQEQINQQLRYLRHVQIEYSSTIKNYNIMKNVYDNIVKFLQDQQSHFQTEMKYITTEPGIGLKRIMIEHFRSLTKKMKQECQTLRVVHDQIELKHQEMLQCERLVKPLIKSLKQKEGILEKQLSKIKEKISKIKTLDQRENLNQSQNSSDDASAMSQSQYSDERKLLRQIPPFKEILTQKHFKQFKKTISLKQLEPFYDLKLIQLQEMIKLQKSVAERTLNKIYELFNENLGSGLEELQKKIIYYTGIKIQISDNLSKIIESSSKYQNQSEKSSPDMKCYQKVEDLFKGNDQFLKSTQIDKFKKSFFVEKDHKYSKERQVEEVNDFKSPTFPHLNYYHQDVSEFRPSKDLRSEIYFSEKKNDSLFNKLLQHSRYYSNPNNNENINNMNLEYN